MTRKSKERKIDHSHKSDRTTKDESSRRELIAAMKLIEKGYRVSFPIGSSRYDLIAEKNRNFIRVQVKNLKIEYKKDSTSGSNDQWVINAYTTHKGKRKTYSKEDTDVIFGVDLKNDAFAIIPVEDMPKGGRVNISEKAKRRQYLNSFRALKEI